MTIIIDNGTATCKFGIAGEHLPRKTIPTIVKHSSNSNYIGNDCKEDDYNSITYPIKKSLIEDWDNMELIWHHILEKELKGNIGGSAVFLTESINNTKKKREGIFEIFFEKFQCPSLNVTNQSVLSLFASGRTSGIVLESGAGLSNAVPISNGYAVKNRVVTSELGGDAVTDHLSTLLRKGGFHLEHSIINQMKENIGILPLNPEEASNGEYVYVLPDGNEISVGAKAQMCAEVVFDKSITDYNEPSITEILLNSINLFENESRKVFLKNTVVSGGNTMFPNFIPRLKKGIPDSEKFNILAPEDRINSSWQGASIFASLEEFKNFLTLKSEYFEKGAASVIK